MTRRVMCIPLNRLTPSRRRRLAFHQASRAGGWALNDFYTMACEPIVRKWLCATPSRFCITFAALVAVTLLPSNVTAALKKKSELGPVKVTVELEPEKPLIGDPVILTVRVVAEKDVEVLMPEFGEALDRFSILDFTPRQTIDDQGRILQSQSYRLQPSFSGKHTIPPILIEFVDRRPGERQAPKGEDAYELLTERIEFEVKSVLPDDASAELKPPMGELEPLGPPPPAKWPWVVGFIVILAAASPFVARAFVEWRRRARRRSAYDIARMRLERLLASRRPGFDGVDAFYVELSGIVRRYLEDRFDMRAPELTTEEFLEAVQQSPELVRSHQTMLREFLRQADLVKFARVQPSDQDIQGSIDSARSFLDETQENAPMIEVSDAETQETTSDESESDAEEAKRA
jgi:hypothetical protein